MKHKRVILRIQADRDVQEAVDYYLNEGAEQAALAFVDAIEQAFRYMGRHPARDRALAAAGTFSRRLPERCRE